MAERVFLHVGTMKSGTSFLQATWWRNRDELADRGLLLPGSRRSDHFTAAVLVGRHHPAMADFSAERSATWERLMAEIAAWPEQALVSHEIFSSASPAQAARALGDLGQSAQEVHVVLTVRDLARQVPSHWQQAVKSRSFLTLTEYWQQVRDDAGHRFWIFHDVPAILDRWGQGIPADRVHVVVTPQQSSPDWLWRATCRLFGVDPAGLRPAGRENEALGIAEVEVMRRVQALIPAEQRDLAMTRLTKGPIARDVIAGSGPAERFVPPAALHGWATERSAKVIASLRDRKYDVVGDLSDLTPAPARAAGRTPDEVEPEEITDVAVASLARMVVRERDHRLEIERLAATQSRLRRRLRQARRSAAPAGAPTPWPRRALAALRVRWRRVSSRGSRGSGPSAAGAPASDVPD